MNTEHPDYWHTSFSSSSGSTLEPRVVKVITTHGFNALATTSSDGADHHHTSSADSDSGLLKRALKPHFLEVPDGAAYMKHHKHHAMDDGNVSPWSFSEEMDRDQVPERRRTPSPTDDVPASASPTGSV